MLGPTLALLVRSLRVDARLLRGHLFRLLLVGLIFGMLGFAQLTLMTTVISAPGLTFFGGICYINAICTTLAAFSYFSTAISEEKDEFTLGLLKMTGMGPLAILLGKSTSRLVTASLALSLQFPFTLLAITLGGVTWVQITAAYSGLFAYLFLLANFGLFCSVYCPNSHKASLLVLRVLWIPLLIVPVARTLVMALITAAPTGRSRWLASSLGSLLEWLNAASVFNHLGLILQTGYAGSDAGRFQVWSNLGLGLVFFGLSWTTFEYFTQRESVVEKKTPLFQRIFRRGARKSRRVWRNPFVWKDYVLVTGGWGGAVRRCLFFASAALAVLLALAANGWYLGQPLDRNTLIVWATCLMVVTAGACCVELSIFASHCFSNEIREKTLPLVTMLPASKGWIWRSKIGGCLLGILPALGFFTLGAAIYSEGFYAALYVVTQSTSWWLTILLFLLFLHLTAYSSLLVNHGSIPIALLLVYIPYTFSESVCRLVLYSPLGRGFGLRDLFNAEFSTVFLLIAAIPACVCTQSLIAPRVRKYAAQPFVIRVGILFAGLIMLYFAMPTLTRLVTSGVVFVPHLFVLLVPIAMIVWAAEQIAGALAQMAPNSLALRWGLSRIVFLLVCIGAAGGVQLYFGRIDFAVRHAWNIRRPQDGGMILLTIVFMIWTQVAIVRRLKRSATF